MVTANLERITNNLRIYEELKVKESEVIPKGNHFYEFDPTKK